MMTRHTTATTNMYKSKSSNRGAGNEGEGCDKEMMTANPSPSQRKRASFISFKTKKGKKDNPNLEGSISDSISSSIRAALKKKARGSSTKKLVDPSSKTATPVKSDDLDEDEDMKELVRAMESANCPQGEIRQARAGLMSRKSVRVFKPPQNHVSFLEVEDGWGDITKDETEKPRHAAENNEAIVASDKNKTIASEDDKDKALILSKKELFQQPNRNLDVLAEGQYFLGISVLVYMYAHLRENCRMGHTRCSMHDVDTNSIQSQYKAGEATRYLDAAKTVGSIIRLVVDELESSNDDDADHEIVGGESRDYEREQAEQFRKWINDSRISQLDEQTEQMLLKMRRDVARHRWRRAISAVRLSYRISGGKPPKWENPAVVPGGEKCNRFVDMEEMMKETIRNQPKYFKDGSVMNVRS
eukprot:scaffold14728_cov100-Skeletonema_dohrnii-CCMP3373.AAC.4